MKFLLIFLPILALPLARLSALGITFDRVSFTSIITDPYSPPGTEVEYDPSFHVFPFGIGEVSEPNALKGLWTFRNTPYEAVPDGTWFMQGSLQLQTRFYLTINEPLSFFITGEVRQLVDAGEPIGGIEGTFLNALFGPSFPTDGVSYFSLVYPNDVGIYELPPITGIRTLNPGQYILNLPEVALILNQSAMSH